MTQDYINFSHEYNKLNFLIFPTIRGKSWFKKIKVGDIRSVHVNRCHLYDAKLIYKKIVRIKDISLDFLQWDTAYPIYLGPDAYPKPIQYNIIADHEEFIDLLNSFYPRKVYEKLKANPSTEVTVLFFEKE